VSWGVVSEGERGCNKRGKMRGGGDEVVVEAMSSGSLRMVVEDEGGGCGR